MFETDVFSNTVFVCIFLNFQTILARFGEVQKSEKSQKNAFGARFKRVWTFGTISEAILERFYRIFAGFGMDFGGMLGGFSIEFEDNSKYFR